MPQPRGQTLRAVLILFVVLAVVTLFLGLEMSSPYTRSSPDCSVWCVLKGKASALFGSGE